MEIRELKNQLSERDVVLLLMLASKVCSEKITVENPLTQKQLDTLREENTRILTKIDKDMTTPLFMPTDGKRWSKRLGPTK